MRRFAMMLKLALLLFTFSSAAGQQLAPASTSVAPSATPSAEPSPPTLDEEIVPTFETQKLPRTYIPDIPANLSAEEYDAAKAHLPPEMTLRGVYLRVYPQGKIAGQIVGYTGRTGRNPDGIIDNHETIWPETEGREGIEQTFNAVLTGKHGEYKITFDKDGRKTSEKIVSPPIPGHTVVTTLDLRLQELAEKALETNANRAAIVIVDPTNGDILALASWPNYNPNL